MFAIENSNIFVRKIKAIQLSIYTYKKQRSIIMCYCITIILYLTRALLGLVDFPRDLIVGSLLAPI